jgi:uncharacterized cupredoxin-like copper-binding protein
VTASTRTRVALAVAVPVAAFALVLAAAHAVGGAPAVAETSGVLGPGTVTVHLTIHHSRFLTDSGAALRVHTGTTVRFVIDNRDPIGHEFIVGDDGVHRRHEAGTEPVHPPRPGEVSVPALSTAETTFQFTGSTGAGDVLYACHLPGHFRYGMSGVVEVVAT